MTVQTHGIFGKYIRGLLGEGPEARIVDWPENGAVHAVQARSINRNYIDGDLVEVRFNGDEPKLGQVESSQSYGRLNPTVYKVRIVPVIEISETQKGGEKD